MITHKQRLAARQTRRGLRTAIAIVLLALMLFPVYWMLNISLQPSGGTLPSSFFPPQPSLAGYLTAIQYQGQSRCQHGDRHRHGCADPSALPAAL
jgi:multiple sugar transport system permease protein